VYKFATKLDWLLLVPVFLLSALGLIAIYSLSLGEMGGGLSFYNRQLIFLILAAVIFFGCSYFDYSIWKNYAGIFYLGSIILLILVFLIGKTTNGAVSWFKFGFFNFQPVELVKISLILLFARYFSQIKTDTITWKHIFISFGYMLVPVVLVILQPDMGSAMVLVAIWLGMVFLAGMKLWQIGIFIIGGIIIASMSWFFVLHDYQKQRILTFLHPAQDALDSGYNVIQATIAIGSGGFGGTGIGRGSQSQLNFIPERHTDFIFATISEESGLIGASSILFFFGLIFIRMNKVIEKAKDKFGRLIVGGVIILIFFQVVVNIGMNLGLVPVAGLSLPFLSYGGSFLIVCMFLVGVVESVWVNKNSIF
jgi:rod shape determining protein RodA